MKKMNLVHLLKKHIANMPIQRNENDMPFQQYVSFYLKSYLNDVDLVNMEGWNTTNFKLRDVIQLQHKIVNTLSEALSDYLNGKPGEAFELLRFYFNDSSLRKYLKFKTIKTGQNFFRLRGTSSYWGLEKRELFHIPFQKRGKVATQRYSIPGFPSLYLGKSIYVCWEELGRPHFHNFSCTRLQNVAELKVVDFSIPNIETADFDELIRFFVLLPAILVCSFRVENRSDAFKPEYIIPQLLYQWVSADEEIDGIRYRSMNVSNELYHKEQGVDNYAFPVKKVLPYGFCSDLISKFHTTEVFSKASKDLSNNSDFTFYRRAEDFAGTNLGFHSELELQKSKPTPYSYTLFGELELYSHGLPTATVGKKS